VLSPDCRQRDRTAIAYLSLLGLTAVRDLACAEARRRCSGCWYGGVRRAARRKRGDAACLVAVVAVDAIEVTGLGEPSEQFQALLVSLRLLEPLPSAGGTSSCVASLIALLALAHEAASAVLIAQEHCCHGHCDGHGLVLFKAAVLADGHHERQLLCGLCAGRLLLGEVPLVKQVRRRGWGGVGAHWRQCREAVPAR